MTEHKNDIYTLEALEDVRHAFGAGAHAFLRRNTSIVFKPDGLVRRTVDAGLAILAEHGFVPVASAAFVFNRNIVREMWHDNGRLPAANFRELVDSFINIGPSLYVMLRHDTHEEADASERIRYVKGPSIVTHRLPEHLRARLGACSTVLSNVHTPDQWSAFLKEFGLLFSTCERRAILDEARSGRGAERVADRVQALYATYPKHDLSVPGVLQRLMSAGKTQQQNKMCVDLQSQSERFLAHKALDWNLLESLAQELAVELSLWDRIVIKAACLEERTVDSEFSRWAREYENEESVTAVIPDDHATLTSARD